MKNETTAIIANLRAEINEVDASLLALLRKRVNLVLAVNFVKRAGGLPVHDPEREASLLAKASYADPEVQGVYQKVIHECRQIAVSHSNDGGDPSAPAERADGS